MTPFVIKLICEDCRYHPSGMYPSIMLRGDRHTQKFGHTMHAYKVVNGERTLFATIHAPVIHDLSEL
jgi:hypothetical protein